MDPLRRGGASAKSDHTYRTLAKLFEQEVTFRTVYMGIRGQEIWTGPTDRPRPGRESPGRPVFATSSPTPTPLRAVKFGDASLYQASIHRAMTLRAFHLRTRCPRSACKAAWLAAYASVSTLSLLSENHHNTQNTQSSRHNCCRRRLCGRNVR